MSLLKIMKTIFVLCVLLIFSCKHQPTLPKNVEDTLNNAGNNRIQLETVINHYKTDSEKLMAAYYLIGNMKDKGTIVHELVDEDGVSVNFNMAIQQRN